MLSNSIKYCLGIFFFYFFIFKISYCNDKVPKNNLYNLLRKEIVASNKDKTSDELVKFDIFFNKIIENYSDDDISNIVSHNIVNDAVYEKTGFFYGGDAYPNNTVLNNINRCVSNIGKYFFAYILSHPSSDLSEIEMYNPKSEMYDFKKNYNLLRKFYFFNRKNSNKNVKSIYFKKILSDIWNILIKPYFSGLNIALYLASYFIIFDRITDNLLLKLFQFLPIPFVKEIIMLVYSYKIVGALSSSKSVIGGILFGAGIFTSIKCYFNIYKKFRSYAEDYKKIALRVSTFRKMLLLMKNIYGIFENNSDLNIFMNKRLKNIFNLINNNSIPEVKWAVDNLLKRDVSMIYFSYKAPSVLAIYNIFNDNRNVFINALCELIRIDSFISLVDYKKECGDNLSFARFIKDNTRPIIKFKNLWNPMLNVNTAVKNNVSIGEEFYNMLLCGHNGGGKSTYLNAILINFILMQTFGLSFSSYSEATVFQKILSFSNISDDINSGDSLYKVEIKRLKDYLQLCKETKASDYFILSVFEEPLSGTDSRSAISILTGIFKYLNKNNDNLINIISSHYNRLSTLEQIPGFRNFYTDVIINHDGSLKYLYKIKEGVPKLSLAIPIASKVGVADDVINVIKSEYDAYVE